MADRVLTFTRGNTSQLKCGWTVAMTRTNGSVVRSWYADFNQTGSFSIAITGAVCTGDEKIKSVIFSATPLWTGSTIDYEAARVNGKINFSAIRIDPATLNLDSAGNGTYSISWSMSPSGRYGNPTLPSSSTFDEWSYECGCALTNISLTITIGTGNSFDGKVESLNEGDKIYLYDGSSTNYGLYTLVQHNYNSGKALIWRDTGYGSSQYHNGTPSNGFINSKLDDYILNTFYANLPDTPSIGTKNTKDFIVPLEYKVAGSMITRNACTVSAYECALDKGSANYGAPLVYDGTVITGERYWTREYAGNWGSGPFAYSIDNDWTATREVTVERTVRPTLGLLNEQLVVSQGDYYLLCEKCLAPTTLLLNNSASDINDVRVNTTHTLSWTDNDIDLWGYNAPVYGFAVWRSTSLNGEYECVGEVTDGSQSMIVSAPEEGGVTYYYRVQSLAYPQQDYCNSDLSTVARAITSKSSNLYYYNGSQWIAGTLKYYNGSNWVPGELKYFNGNNWQ